MVGPEQARKWPCTEIAALAVLPVLLAVVAWLWARSIAVLGLCLSCWAVGALGALFCTRTLAHRAARWLVHSHAEQPTRWTAVTFGPLLQAARQELLRQQKDAEQERDQRVQSEALASLRNQELRRLKAALDTVEHPVLATDPQDKILYANQAASQMLKALSVSSESDDNKPYPPAGADMPVAETANQSLAATLRPIHAENRGVTEQDPFDLRRLPQLYELIAQTRTRRDATPRRTGELDIQLKDRQVAYRATCVNVYDERGVYLGVVTLLSDIRDERLAKTRHAEFVSAVSHEMKTPLSSVKAFVEMLRDGDVADPEEQQELLGFIEMQVDRLTRMINELLNLARIESGVIKVQRQNCDLNEILKKAAEVVKPVAEDKQQHFVLELSELYLPVYADQELLGQAVINLLGNAVKYTPQGGTLRLRSRLDEDVAVFEVEDTGIGIPEEALPRVFERFYRVPQNNKAASGTGLGLALVHYIVTDVHNGSISVTSKVNQGTCFSVRLPLGHLETTRKRATALCTAGR